MIGAAKTQSAGVILNSNYSVNLNPGSLLTFSRGGSATSSRMFSEVIDGVGPFEYLWIIDNNQITINTPTASDTTFTSSGFDVVKVGTATMTVTDKGNGDAQTNKDATITFEFEFDPI